MGSRPANLITVELAQLLQDTPCTTAPSRRSSLTAWRRPLAIGPFGM
jgi:hypothetical protein